MEIIADELWREETGIYLPRLNSAITITSEWSDAHKQYWPGCFFSTTQPTVGASVAIRLGIYASNIFSTSLTVSREIENQWKDGLFVLVPISSRYLLESWGAIHFARLTLDRLLKDNDVEREEIRVHRLTHGSRLDKQSTVQLPIGGVADEQSFNVMKFIDSLSSEGSKPVDGYNFLSEASHPNFIQSSYFQLAGPPLPNWSNDSYKELGHRLLDKTVNIIELAMGGIKSDFLHMLKTTTHYVEKEMTGNEV